MTAMAQQALRPPSSKFYVEPTTEFYTTIGKEPHLPSEILIRVVYQALDSALHDPVFTYANTARRLANVCRTIRGDVKLHVNQQHDEANKTIVLARRALGNHHAMCRHMMAMYMTPANGIRTLSTCCEECCDVQEEADEAENIMRRIWLAKETLAGMKVASHACRNGCRGTCGHYRKVT